MDNTENLDRLIKEYSGILMKTYEKRNPDLKNEEVPVFASVMATEQVTDESPSQGENEAPSQELTDTATFFATVRTGGGAFPVPNAKVIVGKDDTVVSFLVTDQSGDTPKVSLPAYPEKDSLASETVKEVNYYADVFAEGFQEKRNLPVTAVGGAEIVLNVELTPNEERME